MAVFTQVLGHIRLSFVSKRGLWLFSVSVLPAIDRSIEGDDRSIEGDDWCTKHVGGSCASPRCIARTRTEFWIRAKTFTDLPTFGMPEILCWTRPWSGYLKRSTLKSTIIATKSHVQYCRLGILETGDLRCRIWLSDDGDSSHHALTTFECIAHPKKGCGGVLRSKCSLVFQHTPRPLLGRCAAQRMK